MPSIACSGTQRGRGGRQRRRLQLFDMNQNCARGAANGLLHGVPSIIRVRRCASTQGRGGHGDVVDGTKTKVSSPPPCRHDATGEHNRAINHTPASSEREEQDAAFLPHCL